MEIRFLPEAEFEFYEAVQWYKKQKDGLDLEFVLCIDEAIERIKRNPKMFPITIKNARKSLVKKFPYILYYEENVEEIIILAVFHVKRNPKQWQRRV
ncbi:MAG: type II toxin-antitoxin system RelE/ParE family toxin [Desulfobacterales bacterium]|nr:type II toxin-antitoxin system RelE/ParE family toxin [Desulfobacterales bacterium]